jgi:hypothetical protein
MIIIELCELSNQPERLLPYWQKRAVCHPAKEGGFGFAAL